MARCRNSLLNTSKPSVEPSNIVYWTAFALTILVLWIPILSVHYVPLVDYPNHVARMFVLQHYASDAGLQRHFVVNRSPLPDLAMELLFPVLLWLVTDIFTAARLFVLVSAALFAWGVHFLAVGIHGRRCWRALCCALFFYNSSLLYGFMNSVFGIGLFALTAGFWLMWYDKWNTPRVVLTFVLGAGCYFAHLTAFGYLGVLVSARLLVDVRQHGKSRLGPALLRTFPVIPGLIFLRLFRSANTAKIDAAAMSPRTVK